MGYAVGARASWDHEAGKLYSIGEMISAEEAWGRLDPHLAPLPETVVPLRSASGRVLARGQVARSALPFADVSAMDGYAVRGDLRPGARLPVAATVAAGDPPGLELPMGSTVRIMTGAPVPLGADRVVPVEETDGGEVTVEVRACGPAGAHIRRQGEVLRVGNEVLPAGTRLGPEALGLLASQGLLEVPVITAPRVAFLVTGDEIVPPEAEPAPGQLRDSHAGFLLAALAALGLDGESLGIVPDRSADLDHALERGLDADVLLITGGVSRGAFDLVEGALEAAGVEVLFDSVAVQPGKPLVAAVHRAPAGSPERPSLVFGLPGNPASVAACYWLFVRPALRRLMGLEDGFWRGALAARLAGPLPGAKGRDRFLPARLTASEGLLEADPLAPRGSHDLTAWARGDALVRVPAHSTPRGSGEICEVLPTTWW
jgi:molybdopterin molybdotransferase